MLKIFYKIRPRTIFHKIIRLVLQWIQKLLHVLQSCVTSSCKNDIELGEYKDSKTEFDFFVEKILRGENFALARYQDGEYAFMN